MPKFKHRLFIVQLRHRINETLGDIQNIIKAQWPKDTDDYIFLGPVCWNYAARVVEYDFKILFLYQDIEIAFPVLLSTGRHEVCYYAKNIPDIKYNVPHSSIELNSRIITEVHKYVANHKLKTGIVQT